MSQAARLETIEMVVRAPVLGNRVGAVAKTLRAVDRLYALITLVDRADYRDRLAACCRFAAPTDPAARRAPAPPDLASLAQVINDRDRLRLEEYAEESECRFVLTGLAETMEGLREYLGSLGQPSWLPAATATQARWAALPNRHCEDRWRRRVLTLDVAPWFRSCLLEILHRTLAEVAAATTVLAEDAAAPRDHSAAPDTRGRRAA